MAQIKPDWEKVSKSAGLKNKKAASDSWYLLKKKLNKVNTGAGAEEGDDSSKKRKATDDVGAAPHVCPPACTD